jgi:hypothetical protein
MRHIIEKHLKYWPDIAKQADEALNKVLNRLTEEEKEAIYEEDCVVQNPILFASGGDGISSTYYFSTRWGTVEVFLGDAPEDAYVKILNKQLQLIDLS